MEPQIINYYKFKKDNYCSICNKKGHKNDVCPNLGKVKILEEENTLKKSKVKNVVYQKICFPKDEFKYNTEVNNGEIEDDKLLDELLNEISDEEYCDDEDFVFTF